MYKKILTKEEALQKARHYCAYQERSHKEVKEKLYGLGCRKADVEWILCSLIEDNYLNEERFATQFALGKFRMKHWGKIKIRYELKQKAVSTYNIEKALRSIDEEEYARTIRTLIRKKQATLKTGTALLKRNSTIQYLLQKGFENNLICRALDEGI